MGAGPVAMAEMFQWRLWIKLVFALSSALAAAYGFSVNNVTEHVLSSSIFACHCQFHVAVWVNWWRH